MAPSKSSQKFIGSTRPPRVQIEFDDVASAPMAELPFVMNVMADLSGKSSGDLPLLSERKPVQVGPENFDAFLKKQKPTVSFRVPNTLTGDGEMSLNLSFESMDDFSPEAVARKVDALKNLLDSRGRLRELLTKIAGKEETIGPTVLDALRDNALLQELLSRTGTPKVKE